MKILTKQWNRQYKNRHYFFYTRRIWFGRFKRKWKFWGVTAANEAKKAERVLERDGYEFADWR